MSGRSRICRWFLFTEWDKGNASGTQFFNNIFYVEGRASFNWGKSTNTVFEHNVFYGQFAELPSDPYAMTNRPALVNPGNGGAGFTSLAGYRLNSRSSEVPGKVIPDNGGRDFFGRSVPANDPPCVGASECVR